MPRLVKAPTGLQEGEGALVELKVWNVRAAEFVFELTRPTTHVIAGDSVFYGELYNSPMQGFVWTQLLKANP
jgi:hypothetical protein